MTYVLIHYTNLRHMNQAFVFTVRIHILLIHTFLILLGNRDAITYFIAFRTTPVAALLKPIKGHLLLIYNL